MTNPKFIVLHVCIIFGLAACGNQANEVYSAPHSADEAGIILSATGAEPTAQERAQIDKVLSKPGVKFRALSAKHGTYEVFGISKAELQQTAPSLNVEANKYFKSIVPVKHPANKMLKALNKMNGPNPPADQVPPILQACDMQSQNKPVAQIGYHFALNPNTLTMELGETASFDGAASAANANNPASSLDYRWLIMAPMTSEITDEIRPGTKLEFKPDNVGLYQVALVVEDNQKACGVATAGFLVTHNPKVDLPGANDPKPTVELKHFTHLKYVDAEEAWKKSTGKGQTIAVLDTGLNYLHPGIKWNLAIKDSEYNGNSNADDDGNEFTDDYLGWDFVNGDNLPFDDEGHGSHVSGIAASHIFGIAKDAKIMPVKVLNAFGGGDTASVIAGIYYAVDNGATIINASLGSMGQQFRALETAVEYAHSKKVLFVAASGNGDKRGIGLDLSQPGVDVYPAEFEIPNVLSVAATNENGGLTQYSNYGSQEVDVAAPGGSGSEPIWSLATQNAKGYNFVPSGGTSMASPLVAGIAGVVMEAQHTLLPSDVIKLLIASGTNSQALVGKVRSEKVINANIAVDTALPPLM